MQTLAALADGCASIDGIPSPKWCGSATLWRELRWTITGTTAELWLFHEATRDFSPWPKAAACPKPSPLVKIYLVLSIHLITKNVNPFKGLPAGMYCNIIDDCATSITVGSDGKAQVTINNYEEPMFAACVGCETGLVPTATAGIARPTVPTTPKTTVTIPTVPCVGAGCSVTTTTTGIICFGFVF